MKVEKITVHNIAFKYKVPASTGVVLRDKSDLTGMVKNALTHFPDGCDGLAEITVLIGGAKVLPHSGVLALNDATPPPFTIDEPIKRKQLIRVKIDNTDSVNPHTVSVIVKVEGK